MSCLPAPGTDQGTACLAWAPGRDLGGRPPGSGLEAARPGKGHSPDFCAVKISRAFAVNRYRIQGFRLPPYPLSANVYSMGRNLMPDGRRTVVGVRLSDSQAARLDELRGEKKRADWCFEVITSALLAAEPGEPVRVRMKKQPAPGPKAVPQAAFSDPPVNPLPPPGSEIRRCGHPGRRVNGGWCTECQWTIMPGGKFAAKQR